MDNEIIEVGSPEDIAERKKEFKRIRKGTIFSISKMRKRKKRHVFSRDFFICILNIDGPKAKLWCYPIQPRKLISDVNHPRKILPTVFLSFNQLTSLQIEKL